jgi:hypothetical protein
MPGCRSPSSPREVYGQAKYLRRWVEDRGAAASSAGMIGYSLPETRCPAHRPRLPYPTRPGPRAGLV